MVTAVENTILLCLLTCLFAVPLGCLLAILLGRTNVVGRSVAWICLGSQIALPLYVFAGGWCAAVGTQGWLPAIAPRLFQTSQSTGSVLIVALVHTLAAIPWVCFLTSLGLTYSNRSLEETAQLEGGVWSVLRLAVGPQMRIWVMASCLFCCLPILTEMVVTNLYQVPSVAEQIYLDASLGTVTPMTYVAATLLCMLPVVSAGLIWIWLSPPWRDVAFRATTHPAEPLQLGRYRVACSSFVWTVVFALVAIPIVSLCAKAGWKAETASDGTARYGWAFERFVQTIKEGATLFGEEFTWSFVIATVSATASLLVAGLLLRISTGSRALRIAVSCGMLLLVSVPGPAVGMFVTWLLNRSEPAFLGYLYDATIAAPVLAQQFRLLPLAWVIALTVAYTVAPSTLQQLTLDGIRPGIASLVQLLPQLWRKLVSAWVLLAVMSIGELSCSLLVLPPGMTTLSKRLFEMLHFGMRHQDSALCGVLVLLGWTVSLVLRKTLSDRG
ncbi:MAG: hypothetical protein Aurels2KO_32190 [Aureliella sp.]